MALSRHPSMTSLAHKYMNIVVKSTIMARARLSVGSVVVIVCC
jgi:hypothetical protein